MSYRDIQALIQANALNTHVGPGGGNPYVPFDDLLGRPDVERRLFEAVVAAERIALLGPSGSGKSSLIRHVLPAEGKGLAPIVLSLQGDPNTVLNTRTFGQCLIAKICRDVRIDRDKREAMRTAEGAAGRERTAAGIKATSSQSAGLRLGWLSVEVGHQIEQVEPTVVKTTDLAEVADALGQILELIARQELTPVLIFDDTDSWLQRPNFKPDPLIQAFFGDALPWLMRHCAPASIVAVHPAYQDHGAYQDAYKDGFLQRQIAVPRLETAEQLARVLDVHIQASDVVLDDAHVFTEAALARLFDFYAGAAHLSVRRAFVVANLALNAAETAGDGAVDVPHIEMGLLDQNAEH